MKLLKLIQDKGLPSDESGIEVREAARAVLFDNQNLIPLLYVSKLKYHKLPGGGIEVGETVEQALLREVREEVGCDMEVIGELGSIIEYRSKLNIKQTSYCYLGKVVSKGTPKLEPDEIEEGYQTLWVTLDQAIQLIKDDHPTDYEGKFILDRDLYCLYNAKKSLKFYT